jgi:hypothetical protein
MVPFLEASLLEKLDFWCCPGGFDCCFKELITVAGLFFFVFFSFFWLCASVMSFGQCVVAEAGYVIGISAILIYAPYRKMWISLLRSTIFCNCYCSHLLCDGGSESCYLRF